MRGSLGLVIGLVVGAGGMYLGLRGPWTHHADAPVMDAGVVAAAPSDAGGKRSKKRHVRHHRGRGGSTASDDDSAWEAGDTTEETAPQLIQLSAADRAMEWRGDDTSPPKRNIDMSGDSSARALDNGEIQATIASQSGPVQRCVVEAATNTDLSGTITVKMVVDGQGRVSRSKLHAPRYMLEHGLLSCAQRALRGMHFPAAGLPTLVTLPVNFN